MADARPIDDQIRFERRGSVAWITIDRPAVGNALNPPCRDRIRDLINDLNVSRQARCIVITATGRKLFCAGADLSHTYRTRRGNGVPPQVVGDPRRTMLDGQYTLFPAILDSDIPIIAVVNGTAAGMGSHLALACDLVIAADHARFVEVFARRGLVPDALGPWLLPRIIGPRRTMELFLFGDDLPAARAETWGLVNTVVPADELEAAAVDWSERIADGPTLSFGLAKWLVNQSLDVDRAQMIHNESLAVEINTYSEDSREGVLSFRERRDPVWKGY